MGLVSRFALSELQADAILELRLQHLTGLERQKIVDELAELKVRIADLKDILGTPKRIDGIVTDELTALRETHGDPRRTEIRDAANEIVLEDLIADEDVAISISHSGYIKRTALDHLPSPAPRRAREGGNAHAGGGLRQRPLHRLDPLLHPDLHRQGPDLLAEGARDPGRATAGEGQGGGEPRVTPARGEDRGLLSGA